MSRSRFQLLCAILKFDDKITRYTRIEDSGDKLLAIREVSDIFVKACIQNYSPKENLTVDKRLAVFRGKSPFRIYMKSKLGRYGIKIWMCSDSENGYVCNIQVYTGVRNNQCEINQVVLLSTQYHDATIHEDEDRKLEIIHNYNESKGGVDLGDMMASEYYLCANDNPRAPASLYRNNCYRSTQCIHYVEREQPGLAQK
ncbi:hypothetical protein PR048_011347 [Dryococelus australis]|uniref:PiggyBac transposable element-derived protein domain-containing protein n=1 Tax=Dryococelus australis TaxID=614101 RepID=A0ABQ9HLC0_9NEOP|nr:hypothetical protein PR048_011347 [Dryococelus australis]